MVDRHGAARITIALAVAAVLVQTVFFLALLVYPLVTVGDPAWERPMMRARAWEETGQLYFFAAAICAAVLAATLTGGARLWLLVLVACAALFAAHAILIAEQMHLLRHGSLAVPRKAALRFLVISKISSAALALAAAYLVWRARTIIRSG